MGHGSQGLKGLTWYTVKCAGGESCWPEAVWQEAWHLFLLNAMYPVECISLLQVLKRTNIRILYIYILLLRSSNKIIYVLSWAFVGLISGVCWAHIGSMLGRVGPMLARHVGPFWPMLGPCWAPWPYVELCWAQVWQLSRFYVPLFKSVEKHRAFRSQSFINSYCMLL